MEMDILNLFASRQEIPYITAALFMLGFMMKNYWTQLSNNWIPAILLGISVVVTVAIAAKDGILTPFSFGVAANTFLQSIITSAISVGIFKTYQSTFKAVKKDTPGKIKND